MASVALASELERVALAARAGATCASAQAAAAAALQAVADELARGSSARDAAGTAPRADATVTAASPAATPDASQALFIALARFIPAWAAPDADVAAGGTAPPPAVGPEAGATLWDPWCTRVLAREASTLANRVVDAHTDAEIFVTDVLTQYIRPIFAELAKTSRVDAATGRSKAGAAHAQGAAHPAWLAAGADDPLWDARDRRAGASVYLGAGNVLGGVLAQVARVAHAQQSAGVWERVWPLTVPPIMVLLDAPSARGKLFGASLVVRLFLSDGGAPHAFGVPGALLQRTGLAHLLDEALARCLHGMTDVTYGTHLFSATLAARRCVGRAVSGAGVGQDGASFDGVCRLVSEGPLTALSYCAPASASSLAVDAGAAPASLSLLGSPRLQQALVATAAAWWQVLCGDLGSSAVRFWDAWMDWAVGWLTNAFSACVAPFPTRVPRRDLHEVVDEITQGTDGPAHDPRAHAFAGDGHEAALALVHSAVCTARGSLVLLRLVAATQGGPSDAPPGAHATASSPATQAAPLSSVLPAMPPGVYAWGPAVATAVCRCYLQLRNIGAAADGALHAHGPTSEASVHLVVALRALCTESVRADPQLRADIPALCSADARVADLVDAPDAMDAARAPPGAVPGPDADAVAGAPHGHAAAPESTEAAQDAEVCFICAEPVTLFCVPPCSHRVCHICAMRLRALWKNRECTFCKAEATRVIFSESATKGYGEYTPDELPFVDEKLSISFEREKDYNDTIALLRFNCPISSCNEMCGGWIDLRSHVKRAHSRLLCDLCVSHKKIFSHEHAVYTASSLQAHLSAEHRYCEYCRRHFYSDDELWVHMRDRHEQCHICKSRGAEERWRYFRDYAMLEEHFHQDHYVCPAPECLEKKFVVFEVRIGASHAHPQNQMELQVHQVQEHGKALSSRERRDALRVDAQFVYDRPQGTPAGDPDSTRSRARRGARGGDDVRPAGAPQSLQSRRAQFGRALTSVDADAPADPETEQYWTTVLAVLNDSRIKLTACRVALQAYRASETSVRDLLHTVVNVTGEGTQAFDVGTTDLVVQSLAEILGPGEKRAELLDSWRTTRPQGETPTAPATAHARKSVASGNNRVWENVARAASSRSAPLTRSHEHFPRLNAGTSRSASPAPAPARGTAMPGGAARIAPPALAAPRPGSAAHAHQSAQRVRAAAGVGPWASAAPTSGSRAAPSVAPVPRSVPGPRPSASSARVAVSESQFPGLPSQSAIAQRQAEKRGLLGNRGTNPLRPQAPSSRWGAAPRSATDTGAFPSLQEVSGVLPHTHGSGEPADESPDAQRGGKQRRKKGILLSSVGSMHHA
ncbi:RING-type E3 ubiquitin transferase [Malassezia sp. CBS 17886]|nr:RING-type E3 ubiquitin transferase [Malassezia sp. CBS 17886]